MFFFAIDHVLVSLVNLLKNIATIGAIFSLQFTKNRLAAGLRLDPLGNLSAPPDPLAAIGMATSKGGGEEGRGEKKRGGKGRGKEGTEKEGGKEGRERKTP